MKSASFDIKILGPLNLLWAILVNLVGLKWPAGCHLRTYAVDGPQSQWVNVFKGKKGPTTLVMPLSSLPLKYYCFTFKPS